MDPDTKDDSPDLGEAIYKLEFSKNPHPSRAVSKVVAILVWVATLVVASYSSLSDATIGHYNASGEILWISSVGLFIVLFANKRLADITGLHPYFLGWVPIDQPTPLVALRFVGWALLLLGPGVFLFSFLN